MRAVEQEVSPRRERPIIDYPDSDGEPMADNDPQYRCITDTRFALEQYYHDDFRVYVGADLLIYYVEGDPTKSVAPDVLVSLGVPKRNRRSYRLWEEGKPPDVVYEFASERSWRGDLGWKRGLYEGLGIREYFLFDPTGEYFSPVLRGYRLEEEVYQRLPLMESPSGEISLVSEVLGLELWVKTDGEEGMPWVLRLYDPKTGKWLPTPAEEAEARRTAEARAAEAEARAAEEAQARHAAEARATALAVELDRLRAELDRKAGQGG
ncbi:MAG: Uma2 family endonuclease [Nitrospinae bacterium]|nr:Uma2 family endonuclease [Nitrospinota bacterium]